MREGVSSVIEMLRNLKIFIADERNTGTQIYQKIIVFFSSGGGECFKPQLLCRRIIPRRLFIFKSYPGFMGCQFLWEFLQEIEVEVVKE